MKNLARTNVRRIVIRSPTWVGDAVMCVPALRQLRRICPEAHLTLALRPAVEGVFAEATFIDSLLIHESRGVASMFQQARNWRRGNFDMAILLQNAFAAAMVPFLARIPVRIGYATDERRLLLTHALSVPEWRDTKHEVFYYLNIVSQVPAALPGINIGPGDSDCSLDVSEARRAAGQAILVAAGLRGDCITVALCPGSINSRAKRWPAERYATLADRLINERNANVLLIGSAAESTVAAEVTQLMKCKAIDLTGRTKLDEAIAVLSLADLVITNDTGPAHIASAIGRPTLVIFGPTNPLTTRPYSDRAEILRHPPECAPCMLRDCPIDHRCMTAISIDEVFDKALQMLTVAETPSSYAGAMYAHE